MKWLSDFINGLIPGRFQITYDLKAKAKGFVLSQLIVGVVLVAIGFFFRFVEYDYVEFYLNTGIGVYAIGTVFTIKYFKRFESYVNLVMFGAYSTVGLFVVLSGGLFADETFWFALLLAININYGKKSHAILWSIVVSVFLGSLYLVQTYLDVELQLDAISSTERIITLFSFFILLWVITFSYSGISKMKSKNQLKIIYEHKRLLKERDDLMSIIAHDMKSPSNRIEGLIGIFDQSNLTPDQIDVLSKLKGTANEGRQLIDDLIEATSFQATLSVEQVDINKLLDELVTGFLPIANKKDITLDLITTDERVNTESSAYQLRRIIDNLISNAIKFSSPGKEVLIKCVKDSTETSISIADQGPGFTPKDESKMFEMFQTLSAKPTAGESSSGLGLSIVKNLTILLKGKIEYITAPNQGSTFTLIIPNKFPQEVNPQLSF